MTFYYLATPYSKYPMGTTEAYIDACKQAALFVKARIPVFCPIAHTHGVAEYGGISLTDHNIWLPADRPFMLAAKGLIVCMLPSWAWSVGIRHEIKVFADQGKPITYMTPDVIPPQLLWPKQQKPVRAWDVASTDFNDYLDIPVGFRG